MAQILYEELLTQFEETSYPFVDDATLTSTDGFVISKNLFRDALLYPVGGISMPYIYKIITEYRRVQIIIADTGNYSLLTAEFDPFEEPTTLALYDPYLRPGGTLVLSTTGAREISAWPYAELTFTNEATQFVVTNLVNVPDTGVVGIQSTEGEILTDDIWLIGGPGIILQEGSSNDIIVNVVGDPLSKRQRCNNLEDFSTEIYLETINDCGGDIYGNFIFNVVSPSYNATALRIYPQPGGLVITGITPAN